MQKVRVKLKRSGKLRISVKRKTVRCRYVRLDDLNTFGPRLKSARICDLCVSNNLQKNAGSEHEYRVSKNHRSHRSISRYLLPNKSQYRFTQTRTRRTYSSGSQLSRFPIKKRRIATYGHWVFCSDAPVASTIDYKYLLVHCCCYCFHCGAL